MDNYKTPAGKRRLTRNQLRTIYALVQHQHERGSFDGGKMQAAVRKWTADEQLDLEDLLLKYQGPNDDLTIAVRESLQHQQLEDDVQTLWEQFKPTSIFWQFIRRHRRLPTSMFNM